MGIGARFACARGFALRISRTIPMLFFLFFYQSTMSQTYFYPAASFPSAKDQTYTIGGELVGQASAPPLAPRPNPHPSGDCPEVKPSDAPPTNVPISVPVATPAGPLV